MVETRFTRVLLRLGAGVTLGFIYLPLLLVAVYAFNESITQRWPIDDFSTKWFSVAYHNPDVRDALLLSVQAALGATAVAIVLGTLLSLAMARFAFFGRETITLLVILPIALPGIVTGLALQTTYTTRRRPLRADDDHHRPRDVLHRRHLQQRGRASAASPRQSRGGVEGPRR